MLGQQNIAPLLKVHSYRCGVEDAGVFGGRVTSRAIVTLCTSTNTMFGAVGEIPLSEFGLPKPQHDFNPKSTARIFLSGKVRGSSQDSVCRSRSRDILSYF